VGPLKAVLSGQLTVLFAGHHLLKRDAKPLYTGGGRGRRIDGTRPSVVPIDTFFNKQGHLVRHWHGEFLPMVVTLNTRWRSFFSAILHP